jgi:polar amino acid transport system ATP-binding protein
MVRFDGVVKRFGGNVVLDHLDFAVDRGDRVTLIGPSGSGKTTILRLLMTLERVDGGTIFVAGQPLSHMPRGDGLVPPARGTCVACGAASAWCSTSSTCSPT